VRYSSADFGFLCIGRYDLTNISTKFEDSISRPMIDSTPYGTASAEVIPGLFKTYELTGHEGWYDDSAYSINAAMVDLAVGANVFMMAPFGNDAPTTTPVAGIGNSVICSNGLYKTAFKRSGSVGDYTKASFEVAISGTVDQKAKLVAPLVARTVTGTTAATYLDMGAPGTVNGRAYLVVTDILWDTRTSLDIEIQDGTTPPTFADHTSFTQILPATTPDGTGTSEMVVLEAAAIDQYTCVTWTWAGGSASDETVTFAVAVVYD
jgi:hypothetical protein